MLELHNVSLNIGSKTLLDDVSLTCQKGSVTALIGPNGAGKSTLLGVMAGDHSPSQGDVWLNGQPLTSYSIRDLAAERAVMPQDSVLRFGYCVEDVVRMGRAMRDLPPEQDESRVEAAMQRVEIWALRQRNAMTLSGGEQARTTFARVQVQETPILLLDEPTAALDLRHQERLMQLATQCASQGHCVVAVMHDLNLAAAHADQLALLDAGKLIATGSPWGVLNQKLLENIYQQDVCVLTHPVRDCPVVLTSPARTEASLSTTRSATPSSTATVTGNKL
ncbi:heme ABC transporter ATP-binding protein [Vreelandella titanicae]|uniref:heme ABC transporter ATP-binding protein n=1 Tax=Vreelandella titanicae TaxID=664683 RepID=UPI00241D6596|nr:heme ABC transporter ATP-binding protein [Halomonas titanicae]